MPWGTFVRLFRSRVVIILTCTLLASLLAAVPAMAQSSGRIQYAGARSTAQSPDKAAPKAPERLNASNQVVKGFRLDQILLGSEAYHITPATKFFAAAGTPMARSQVKAGQVVDIVYLTGGAYTERYPFRAFDKVLVSVRVVAGAQPR